LVSELSSIVPSPSVCTVRRSSVADSGLPVTVPGIGNIWNEGTGPSGNAKVLGC
jgi:hypothetical protein